MPGFIVDPLEVVDVDRETSERLTTALRDLPQHRDREIHSSTVSEAGQWIGKGVGDGPVAGIADDHPETDDYVHSENGDHREDRRCGTRHRGSECNRRQPERKRESAEDDGGPDRFGGGDTHSEPEKDEPSDRAQGCGLDCGRDEGGDTHQRGEKEQAEPTPRGRVSLHGDEDDDTSDRGRHEHEPHRQSRESSHDGDQRQRDGREAGQEPEEDEAESGEALVTHSGGGAGGLVDIMGENAHIRGRRTPEHAPALRHQLGDLRGGDCRGEVEPLC